MNRILRFLAFVCLTCQVGLAQNAQLSGLVKDKTGAVVPLAQVTLQNVDTNAVLRAKTSQVGFYVFSSVIPGRYNLSADANGFDTTVISGVKIDTAANVSQDITLGIKQGSESITVTQRADLNTADGTVSTVISHEFIENMPLNGKDLTTLFELSPGTILNAGGSPSQGGGFSVDGQRPTANYLTIDGVTGNSAVSSISSQTATGAGIATSASGGTNGILPIDAIEEYRMDTSTYTAENGRTPGGQIQVRTKSGTNEFHGTLFENFRNQVLDDTDWFTKYNGIKQSQLRMNDFGGTIGGPILIPHLYNGRNKLFFFAANDNLVLDQPVTASNKDIPSASVVSQAYPAFQRLLSGFPAGGNTPGGTGCPTSDPYCDPSYPGFDLFSYAYPYLIRDHTTSLRFDAQLLHSIHGFFRANIAPSKSYQYSYEATGSDIDIYTYTGGITIPVGTRIIDDLTANHTATNASLLEFIASVGGNNPNAISANVPSGVDLSTEYFALAICNYQESQCQSLEDGATFSNKLSQWNVVDTLSWQRGTHSLKFGADILTKTTHSSDFANEYYFYLVMAQTGPNTNINNGNISALYYYHNNEEPVVSLGNVSLFVNDDWKLESGLTINAGLRWEYNPPPDVGPLGTLAIQGISLNPATIEASVSNAPLYKTRYDNFAPRFGFSWSPFRNSESSTLIRGGAGIYFDTGQAATVADLQPGSYPYQSSLFDVTPQPYGSVNWTALVGTATTLPESRVYLVDPKLMSPRTYEWSLTVEQPIGKSTRISTSYVGNDGERLIGEEETYNAANSAGQYPVNTSVVSKNGDLFILANQSHSNYQALQLQLTSNVGTRLTALASYSWAHAEDNGETDFSSVAAAARNPLANSANDIRHLFAAAIHYAPAGYTGNRIMRAITSRWGLDTIARLQAASPFSVTTSLSAPNLNTFLPNADVVPGVPAVLHAPINPYSGKAVPGGKLLNYAAFTAPPAQNGQQLRQGDSPMNGYRLFGLAQWDIAASRAWKVWKEADLVFRIDAYNVVNHPNFADVNSAWSATNASTFGASTETYASLYGAPASAAGETGQQLGVFQNGGPREIQLSMKIRF